MIEVGPGRPRPAGGRGGRPAARPAGRRSGPGGAARRPGDAARQDEVRQGRQLDSSASISRFEPGRVLGARRRRGTGPSGSGSARAAPTANSSSWSRASSASASESSPGRPGRPRGRRSARRPSRRPRSAGRPCRPAPAPSRPVVPVVAGLRVDLHGRRASVDSGAIGPADRRLASPAVAPYTRPRRRRREGVGCRPPASTLPDHDAAPPRACDSRADVRDLLDSAPRSVGRPTPGRSPPSRGPAPRRTSAR